MYGTIWKMITNRTFPTLSRRAGATLGRLPKFGEYDQLIRLDRIPQLARERILEYTDKEFPAFRQYLQRDIERYQEPKK